MSNKIAAFLNDESGATAIEYGLIAALVSVAGIAAFRELGDSLGTMFDTVSSTINDAIPEAEGTGGTGGTGGSTP